MVSSGKGAGTGDWGYLEQFSNLDLLRRACIVFIQKTNEHLHPTYIPEGWTEDQCRIEGASQPRPGSCPGEDHGGLRGWFRGKTGFHLLCTRARGYGRAEPR